MKILQEFKAFAMRGNVVDMAVGVIIGGAFGKIVTSLVNDIVMPLIGIIIGGVNFKELKWTFNAPGVEGLMASHEVSISYGNFIQVTFDFLIIAFSIFMAIKLINRLTQKKKKEEEAAAAAPAPAPEPVIPEDVKLLQEIRDLLKEKK